MTRPTIRALHRLLGLCPDPHGNVANHGAGKVKKVDPKGRVSVFARSPYPYSPTGIAVVGEDVYVLEYGWWAVRVRKFSGDGTVRVFR